MRSIDIAIFLILIQASIGFVNELDIFDVYIATDTSSYKEYTISNASSLYSITETPSALDYAEMTIDFIWQGIWILFKLFGTVFFIFPTLITVFQVPAVISGVLQVGIYIIYALGYYQIKTNRTLKQMM